MGNQNQNRNGNISFSKRQISNKFLVGLSQNECTYTINGVKYIVKSRFKTLEDKNTLSNRIGRYLKSDFAQLHLKGEKDKIDLSYVYLTAGEED